MAICQQGADALWIHDGDPRVTIFFVPRVALACWRALSSRSCALALLVPLGVAQPRHRQLDVRSGRRYLEARSSAMVGDALAAGVRAPAHTVSAMVDAGCAAA
jgi:hypothetical protein